MTEYLRNSDHRSGFSSGYTYNDITLFDKNKKIFYAEKDTRKLRIDKVKGILRLDHLNEEERNHVERLVMMHADLFRLSEDSLGCTNEISHKINTVDDNKYEAV